VILIGLGANLDGPFGAPEKALKACADIFRAQGFEMIQSSNIWKTAPVPVSDQPWYRNAVCSVRTRMEPQDLLRAVKAVEHDLGRQKTEINAPRVIDLDILSYHDVVMDDGDLIVPHPRLQDRAFVLYPLREIAPQWRHPVLGKAVDEMIAQLPQGQKFECLEGSWLI
jgi:2-amino-4-hydroxy-6-hydroxymethyldihydropteridine diphosphokinase